MCRWRVSNEISKWDSRFLDMAKLVASWSKDPSTQAGAVIVNKDKIVVSVGFNGFASSMPDSEEYYNNREEKYSRIIHAEMNAVLFAKSDLKDCTLYVYPFLTCDRCFVHATQAGIKRIVAPKVSVDKAVRWGEAFSKVRIYAQECNVEIVEV